MMRWRIDTRRLDDFRLSVGLLLPACAGLAFFGMRVIGVWALIAAGALIARLVLKRLRSWRDPPDTASLAINSVLLGLFYPATLYDLHLDFISHPDAQWPALVGAGVLLAIASWLSRWQQRLRFHPVALVVAILAIMTPSLCLTDRVLTPRHLFSDVLDERADPRSTAAAEPWIASEPDRATRVFVIAPAEQRLDQYLHGIAIDGAATQTMSRLVSDDLPPLEDLVIGGHPRRIGCASAIALLIGGLFLVYRGYVAWRIPVLGLLAIYGTLLVIPLPVTVGPEAVARAWLAVNDARVGVGLGLTFVNYLIAASPLLLVTLFLATRPDLRPSTSWQTWGFAITFGVLAAVLTGFFSVTYGAIFALLIAHAVFGWIDRPKASAVNS